MADDSTAAWLDRRGEWLNNLSDCGLDEIAAKARQACADWLRGQLRLTEQRCLMRSRPPIALLGPAYAGKDTAAAMAAKLTSLVQTGSTSAAGAPFVEAALNRPWAEIFPRRQQIRTFLRRFFDAIRQGDPAILSKLSLAHGDIVNGIRGADELAAAKPLFGLTIWLENPRVPPDPTLEFRASACDIVLLNDSDLPALEQRLLRLLRFADYR